MRGPLPLLFTLLAVHWGHSHNLRTERTPSSPLNHVLAGARSSVRWVTGQCSAAPAGVFAAPQPPSPLPPLPDLAASAGALPAPALLLSHLTCAAPDYTAPS